MKYLKVYAALAAIFTVFFLFIAIAEPKGGWAAASLATGLAATTGWHIWANRKLASS